jgi:hypothetical protein
VKGDRVCFRGQLVGSFFGATDGFASALCVGRDDVAFPLPGIDLHRFDPPAAIRCIVSESASSLPDITKGFN